MINPFQPPACAHEAPPQELRDERRRQRHIATVLAALTLLTLLPTVLPVVLWGDYAYVLREMIRYGETFHLLALMLVTLGMAYQAVRPSRTVLFYLLLGAPVVLFITWRAVGEPPFERFGGNDGPGLWWGIFVGLATLALAFLYWLVALIWRVSVPGMSRAQSLLAWTIGIAALAELATVFLGLDAEPRTISDEPGPFLLLTYHSLWGIPLLPVALITWKRVGINSALLGFTLGFLLRDLVHHFAILPLIRFATDWRYV